MTVKYSDAEVRYFLAKAAITLGHLPFDRRLMEGWDRFVAWHAANRLAKPYEHCLQGLRRSTQ